MSLLAGHAVLATVGLRVGAGQDVAMKGVNLQAAAKALPTAEQDGHAYNTTLGYTITSGVVIILRWAIARWL